MVVRKSGRVKRYIEENQRRQFQMITILERKNNIVSDKLKENICKREEQNKYLPASMRRLKNDD